MHGRRNLRIELERGRAPLDSDRHSNFFKGAVRALKYPSIRAFIISIFEKLGFGLRKFEK
jgi:hypothetical protein